MLDIFHNQLCTETPECSECARIDALLEWQGPMWNDCGSCNYMRRTEGRRYCAWCAKECGVSLDRLAHNLAIAGFGAAMFKAGDNFGFHMGSEDLSQCTCQWAPGRGEPYRGATRCEQDAIELDEHEFVPQRCKGCGEELDLCCCPFDDEPGCGKEAP